MTVDAGWVRSVDAIDLMTKSGWSGGDAKARIANLVWFDAMKWRATEAYVSYPEDDNWKPLEEKYRNHFGNFPFKLLFSCLADNVDGVARLRYESNGLNIFLANWITGCFSATEIMDDGEHISIHINHVAVEKSSLVANLSAGIIENHGHVLNFDQSALGRRYFEQFARNDFSESNAESPPQRGMSGMLEAVAEKDKHRVSTPALRRWFLALGEDEKLQTQKVLLINAKRAFPTNTVPRHEIEKLAGGRKPGRKPIPRQ